MIVRIKLSNFLIIIILIMLPVINGEFILPKEEIIFPSSENNSHNSFVAVAKANVSFLKLLNKVKNKEEFAEHFGFSSLLSPRVRSKPDALSSGVIDALPAGCNPVLTPVHLPLNEDSSVLYYPQCVLIERCDGCCYGDFLSCQPEKTEEVKFKVLKISSASAIRRRSVSEPTKDDVIVTEVKHVTCSCKCRVMESDCNSKVQKFNENECKCDCIDRRAESECLKNSTKYWDYKGCSCLCREILECSSGFQFDHTVCGCKRRKRENLVALSFSGSNGKHMTEVLLGWILACVLICFYSVSSPN